MGHVIFVAPFFLPTTVTFIEAFTSLRGVTRSLISQDAGHRLPENIKSQLDGYAQVSNCLDPGQLVVATQQLARKHGPVHRFFGVLEELQVPLAQVREHLGIKGMWADAARRFRNKALMKETFRTNGLPCARYILAESTEAARQFCREVGFPVVVKPPDGAGAKHTFELRDQQSLDDYLGFTKPHPQRPVMFEEFIQGTEHSFEAMSIDGNVVWHSSTRYYPTPLEVLKNPWIQWCILLPKEVDSPEYQDIYDANKRALQVLGMQTGLSHMEWFRRKDGSIAISEVGARPPGAQMMRVMSYAHDFNAYRAWMELMAFDRFQQPERKYAAGAAFLRGQGEGRIKAIHGLKEAQAEVGDLVVEARLPTIGAPKASTYEGDGYVLVRHPDTEVVKHTLSRLVSLIRVELA